MNYDNIAPLHPVAGVHFVMLQPTTRKIKNGLEAMLDMLEYEREWIVAPPQSFDFLEEPEHGGDLVHVYGCTMAIFTPRPPWGNLLPNEIERLHYEEVSRVMQEVCSFSDHFQRDFVVELDNIRLGHIVNGAPDEALATNHSEWRDSIPQ